MSNNLPMSSQRTLGSRSIISLLMCSISRGSRFLNFSGSSPSGPHKSSKLQDVEVNTPHHRNGIGLGWRIVLKIDYSTYHFLVESSNESSPFPAMREVMLPVLFPLDLIGGMKLPRIPRRGNP